MNKNPNGKSQFMASPACEVCGGSLFHYLFRKNGLDYFRCDSCQLSRIQPQPSDETLAQVYSDKYFESWGVQTDATQVERLKQETFRRHVLSRVRLKKNMRVLDCGAAFGALMTVAQEAGCEAYGIELSPAAARHITEQFGPDRVFSGPFEQADFPGLGAAGFDVVFMCDFIEHVRDPLATLRKATRLLRPGGQLVITTPDTASPSCHLMRRSWPHYHIEHLFYFNRRNLAQALTQTGFTVTYVGAAKKVIDFDYLRHHFNARPQFLITSAANLLARCMGRRLRTWLLTFSLGQMILVADCTSSTSSP